MDAEVCVPCAGMAWANDHQEINFKMEYPARVRKVTLIEPKPPGYHVYSRIALPRLGLPLLGAILKGRGCDVSIYCQDIQEVDYSDALSSDLVGISTTTSTAPEAYRMADRFRQRGVPVVIGGPHVTFLPDETLEHADFCVRGEGEETLPQLVDAINAGGGFEGIAGLSYRSGDDVFHNSNRPLCMDLDSLPVPDLSLIKGNEKITFSPVATSRGCPFNCHFCSVTRMFGQGMRYRSVDGVVDELKQLKPGSRVFFYDDNFTANRRRTTELLEKMLREDVAFPWTAQARIDVARDKELLRLMKKSNCYILYLGLESVNPETLKEYDKKQQVEEIVEAVRRLHEHEIMVHGMFVVGSDHDTSQTLRDTVKFALKHKVDTVQFMMLTPLPGTPYFKEMEESGRLLTKDWTLYDGQHVVFQPKNMTAYELQKETFKAMKRFYRLSECVKMFAGYDFLRFMARFNANILLGRWGSAMRHLRARVLTAFYRAYGHFLIKRWESANKDFAERIRSIAHKAREITHPGGSGVETVD